ncbi:similar to Saccharomyces cerevisiae YKL205W LOS1 Nuclear pore protein involved in nuclear export of pre-tRNA and in re-export of mature tRNAs after their retrograde import from the cytoplasm [Maudiozyma barnettii]|uniref:Exportin-T n=1 Tax=Maudiozyma barnettii TaxID=61262 RepID=A0A8H2ZI98_9SACH|nr:Ran GTPase-binding protein LOS1 [Kazachstania barnettii]CAB4254733.1 similar to Saccharomyces cerevisiae YKL205W LOS1 Nuclear pore protein involved in nuclear export of pre-tRNA and in re-export of mature tRNAs after their retrograde import from the cytoplasm [Kazachstania barnettii]CAD1782776.1 similar to Saccharomyces cerevisiae YKL205W LOS1 Nuclear pore protein involved in nuclear export of pre-tRNA and in re-export of mature tRNAs after their retrograde import from the cytoplasm [Kazachsta
MLQRIRNVISVANDSTSDVDTKKQALNYLNEMKDDPNASQFFSSLLIDPLSDDITKFVSLQVLCDIVNQASLLNNKEQIVFIKTTTVNFIRDLITNDLKGQEYFRNKIAELITRLFYASYGECNGNQWITFFSDMISLLSIESLVKSISSEFSPLGLDFFARICGFINTEIADQTFVRSKDIQIKNNSLKDSMRIQDVSVLVTIWLNSLKSMIPSNGTNVAQAQIPQINKEISILILSCIGSYISWIDVNLIINEEYISVIYSFLDYHETQIACCQCLCEIISKKMKPVDKLTLLSMLSLTEKIAKIEQDDLEVYEQIAKLVSSVGLELAIILDQCNDISPQDPTYNETQQVANAADQQILLQVSPLVLKFMVYEYDSVTQQCFPFITQYLGILKKLFALGGKPGSAVAMASKKQTLTNGHSNFLFSLLEVIVKKMRIDESSDEDSQDEIDEFNETIRSKIKTFQDSVCVISPTIYLQNITNQIESLLLLTNSNKDWRDPELMIYQIHNLAESIRNNLFGVNKNEISTSEPAQIMVKFMDALLQNPTIFTLDNSYVQISFFELVVRHNNFLNNDKDEFALLNIFCSDFGMFNKREKVRIRTWYLFTRLLKITKPKLSTNIINEIINKLSQLLVIKVGNVSADGTEDDTTFSNQMYLFEGIGLLIGANSDQNYDILDNVLTPLFKDLETCISSQIQTPEVILQCHHILMAIGTLARGVQGGLVPENQVNNVLVNKKLITKSLIEKFSNIAEVVLVTFSFFNKFENIRDASRFTFSRLIPILNSGIIPFTNKLIALFLESDLKVLEMNDFLGFLGQMVHMFHKDEGCYQLYNDLLTPTIEKIHSLLSQIEQEHNTNPGLVENNPGKNIVITDTFRDKVLLKKAYYSFLQSFITNSVTSLLLSEKNFNTLSLILTDLLTYTPEDVQETSAMKLAFNVLFNFVKYFGSGKCTDPNDIHAANTNRIEGLNEFLITKAVPLVFEIPFRPEYKFNIKEGSYRVMASDLSRLLKELYVQSNYEVTDMNSNPCLKYLSEIYLPQIQFPNQLIMELIEVLVTLDQKAFEKYYVSLIEKLTLS